MPSISACASYDRSTKTPQYLAIFFHGSPGEVSAWQTAFDSFAPNGCQIITKNFGRDRWLAAMEWPLFEKDLKAAAVFGIFEKAGYRIKWQTTAMPFLEGDEVDQEAVSNFYLTRGDLMEALRNLD